ncbi:MAG TPA: 23S rRNA (pseudouridine(1915)-N(3))-methyltransferase RlmH [Polyangiaceae bacterium]|nr:23S rRNA (pseudouridine(1915)-N(3))-methyltransferase RlmH [Polyangiaceae bacterium]
MKLYVVAVGKLKDRAYRSLADDYLQRIARYARVQEIEVRGPAELATAAPAAATTVALEVTGEALTSPELARRVQRWGSQGKGDIAFFIGGAEGLPEDLSKRASARLSLSRLTLPHRLARVVLLEQLYRSLTISRGEPNARED